MNKINKNKNIIKKLNPLNILIFNNVSYHYEILETIITKYRNIFPIPLQYPGQNIKIVLFIHDNSQFESYIRNKYPQIKIEKKIQNLFSTKNTRFDYIINCTVYEKDYKQLVLADKHRYFAIAHEVTGKLKKIPNVYFLTPLASAPRHIITNILPFAEHRPSYNIFFQNTIKPIYIIQGNITSARRNFELLDQLLQYTPSIENITDASFIVKVVGRGNLDKKYNKYIESGKLIVRTNLPFEDFHREFADVYCIIPLVSKQTHPSYFTNKLTSSINYARGYNLFSLLENELQKIYRLPANMVFCYEDKKNNFLQHFERSLFHFYQMKKTLLENSNLSINQDTPINQETIITEEIVIFEDSSDNEEPAETNEQSAAINEEPAETNEQSAAINEEPAEMNK